MPNAEEEKVINMAKLVGQDTSKSVTGFGATSPGQSGKNFNTGTKAGSTISGSAASATFGKSGQKKGGALGDKFRRLAELRKKSSVATAEPGKRSGKPNLNKVF